MIRISDKSLCCGCTACATVCPAQCIVLRRDREGFDYPVANPDLCINCGKCEKVCPMQQLSKPSETTAVYAVRAEAHLGESSSGGVFPVIAGKMIEEGGVVFGAVLEPDKRVAHYEASTMEELQKMRGSKYAQSDLYSTFEDIAYYLKSGQKVLFSGTPCQVAGLLNSLGGPQENLLTVDFACHGVPSPGLWEKYVKALEASKGSQLKEVKFRDKSEGWRHYCFRYDDVSVPYVDDPFMALFVQDMSIRPSCYSCRFRAEGSGSDLRLADLWSVSKAAPEFDDDKGVTAVFVNTEKGAAALEVLKKTALVKQIDENMAKEDNGGFAAVIAVPEKREEFFKGVHSTKDLIAYMSTYVVRRPMHIRMYRSVRKRLSQIKRRIVK
ncbi:MAG: Coenzyme F420 hydrogenase/dehydrogenase, beta subunit C-terminal domain [Bacteroidales bacterium]|nr:Coenzyme F420 hydrogenase/dehydrogenase, beta subunit C-terminal domain [Bacteroidales bacterium]